MLKFALKKYYIINYWKTKIDNLFQEIEYQMIVNKFLSNVKPIENSKINIHPTATMIKESFKNIGDGDILGFHESYFSKPIRKHVLCFEFQINLNIIGIIYFKLLFLFLFLCFK